MEAAEATATETDTTLLVTRVVSMRPAWRAFATLPYLHYQAPQTFAAHASASAGEAADSRDFAAAAEAGPSAEGVCTIGYVTDIEGNRDFFDQYVRTSKVLERDGQERLRLRDGCELVFGGDVCDKGDGDLYVAGELLGLKRRHPGRVHIILGNRDVNKLRWAQELGKAENLLEYAAASGAAAGSANADSGSAGGGGSSPCIAWWTDVRPFATSDAQRCRWMLRSTMGSQVPDTFELRRQELALMRAGKPADEGALPPSSVADDGHAR
ncbi:hypothetical protein T492DRAFT_896219 [Pavlovales sp. CCMP2436]|nr:hypothetical protein T492DRAFT_896219 [Pavlovales sp. CCMP2436]